MSWRSGGLNPGLLAKFAECEASTLPLSYTPESDEAASKIDILVRPPARFEREARLKSNLARD